MTAFEEKFGRDDIEDAMMGPSRRSSSKADGVRANDAVTRDDEQRDTPRLRLSYAIAVGLRTTEGIEDLDHATTDNLSARGAYFCTPNGSSFHVGLPVSLTVSVPHRIATDGREVLLSLQGDGHVVRLEDAARRRFFGEDGLAVTGVAIEFFNPLRFDADWF